MQEVVIIPAYNESKYLLDVILKTKKFVDNIIVVNDGSTDNTLEILDQIERITVLNHPINLGKGAALKTGCDYAFKNDAKKIVVMDADGQHNPGRIIEFIEKLNQYDLIFGYRKRSKKMPALMRIGNWGLNQLVLMLFKVKIKDTQCGFRAFNAKVYPKIRWQTDDYSMESEMIAKAGKHKINYAEIPIETIYQDNYKGTTILDGMKIGLNMLFWRFRQ
jgi:glycosyltransferase involved in cell wall biosynthesis